MSYVSTFFLRCDYCERESDVVRYEVIKLLKKPPAEILFTSAMFILPKKSRLPTAKRLGRNSDQVPRIPRKINKPHKIDTR